MGRRTARPVLALLLVLAAAAAGLAAGCGDDDGAEAGTAAAPPSGALLASATAIDREAGTITLPLFEGRTADDATTWYVVTESSDAADAEERGVNHAPKLANALGTAAVQEATAGEGGLLTFAGTVDFSPERSVTPGPDGFPPDAVAPGAVGDDAYSPLVTTDGSLVLNATQVQNDSGTHDAVTAIDTEAGSVTLTTLPGFFGGQEVTYLRLDASVDVVAALEESVLAPNLNAAPGIGASDPETSARSAIVPIVNGVRGADEPRRQGLQSAVLGEGPPLNVQHSLPGGDDYSPIWDVVPAVWSDAAVAGDERTRVTSTDEVAALAQAGALRSGGERAPNADLGGLRSAGFVSNCPTVAVGG